MRNKINFEALNSVLLGSFESYCRQWLPDGKRSGAEYASINPTRNDGHAGSFSINLHKGIWSDFACGDSGSDPVSLYAYLFHNNDQGAAGKELSAMLGLDKPVVVTKKAQPKWLPIVPPMDAPAPPNAHLVRGLPEAIWIYRDFSGRALGYMFRFKTSSGGKEVLPLTWGKNSETGKEEWRWMGFKEPRYLYGLDRLATKPDATVLITEGEKCADAAANQLPELACLTWPGGSKAVSKVDWLPLAGRKVIIWPDCDAQKDKAGALLPEVDQPGVKAATQIADKLVGLGCRVWLMEIPKPGERVSGWDIADAIDEGLSAEALAEYIRAKAKPLWAAERPVETLPPEFVPISSAAELLERYALIYGHGGTVFDFAKRIMLKQSDMIDACISRDYAKQWQSSAVRKIVGIDNVGFDPGGKDGKIICNLWDGWPTVPVKGDCSQLLRLVKYMCGNEESDTAQVLFEWLIKWLAYPIQHPGAKMKTAVVVHGPQGTGKNLIFEVVMEIYGCYGRIIGQDAIEDKFNDWASKKLFLIADEVVARSDLYHVKNKLKSFITGDWIRINPKNLMAYEERNHVNLVFLSNERMPVVLEEDDRRHAVIWTPEKLTASFYKTVAAEKENGGVAAFHEYLLQVELGDFNEHTPPPMTGAKQDLIDLSKDTINRFYEEWEAGHIDGFTVMPVLSEDFYELYKAWCGKQGVKPGSLVKMVDMMLKRLHCTRKRCRYVSKCSSVIYPKTFIFPEDWGSAPDGKTESGWLGAYVDEFNGLLGMYRGRNASGN